MKIVMQMGIILVIFLTFLGGCATSGDLDRPETLGKSSCPKVKCDFTGGSHTQIVWPHDLLGNHNSQLALKYFEKL